MAGVSQFLIITKRVTNVNTLQVTWTTSDGAKDGGDGSEPGSLLFPPGRFSAVINPSVLSLIPSVCDGTPLRVGSNDP